MKELKTKIISYLEKELDTARFKHTMGTCRIAVELARNNSIPENNALLAALLHDAGKGLSKPEMVGYARKYRLKVPFKDIVVKHNPSLLHSYISADIAKRLFKVKNRSVLSAITLHTVGGQKMDALAKIMYVADAVAYDRRYPGVKALRKLAYSNIDAAVKAAMANKLYYVIKKKAWLHPEAVKAWNSVIKEI